jgi:hypothetical protein
LGRVRADEQRKRRRVQWTLALSVAGLAAAAGFGVVLALFWQHAGGAKAAAELARDGEQIAREKLTSVEYCRTVQLAYQEWRDDNVGAALALLEATRPELRGWEWRYVWRLCHADLLTLRGHRSSVYSASFSPDGSRIVTASMDGTAKVWDSRTGAETSLPQVTLGRGDLGVVQPRWIEHRHDEPGRDGEGVGRAAGEP